MAALDFPTSPTDGQTYTANGKTFKYSSASSSWNSITGTGYTGSRGADGASGKADITFSLFSFGGDLVEANGLDRWYVDSSLTISSIFVSVSVAPTGAPIIFDVNKNGTTIFTNQANRPTIAVETFTYSSTPDITTATAGDYFTVDVDQVGSTIAGTGGVVRIILA